ncbi:hypothetical protein TNCV_3439551 [Trichonephila clavipes]|nr:hypothetical protein TNCV_3439551 [Trichonephila clavipes]
MGVISGSEIRIHTTNGFNDIKIINQNICSVLRFELIAIRRALQYTLETETQFPDVWIMTDGIDGNEKANFLVRTAAEKEVSCNGYLTLIELSSLKKIELHHLGRTPPSPP